MDAAEEISTESPSLTERDDLYYLEPIVFQVSQSRICIIDKANTVTCRLKIYCSKYHFARDSEIFSDMLTLPQSVDNDREGSCDATPLVLNGVNKDDFKRLLRVMYPL
jgi:hypothetical protein